MWFITGWMNSTPEFLRFFKWKLSEISEILAQKWLGDDKPPIKMNFRFPNLCFDFKQKGFDFPDGEYQGYLWARDTFGRIREHTFLTLCLARNWRILTRTFRVRNMNCVYIKLGQSHGWVQTGGVLLIGYEMFRGLIQGKGLAFCAPFRRISRSFPLRITRVNGFGLRNFFRGMLNCSLFYGA